MPEKIKKLDPQDNTVESGKLDDVSGGAILYAGKHAQDPEHPWEVIDAKTGEIIGSYATKRQAIQEEQREASSNVCFYRPNTLTMRYDAWKQHDKFSELK